MKSSKLQVCCIVGKIANKHSLDLHFALSSASMNNVAVQ